MTVHKPIDTTMVVMVMFLPVFFMYSLFNMLTCQLYKWNFYTKNINIVKW